MWSLCRPIGRPSMPPRLISPAVSMTRRERNCEVLRPSVDAVVEASFHRRAGMWTIRRLDLVVVAMDVAGTCMAHCHGSDMSQKRDTGFGDQAASRSSQCKAASRTRSAPLARSFVQMRLR